MLLTNTSNVRKVIIAGAGPGDPELITVKLQHRLAESEVIICDRLVNPQIINKYAPASVTVIQVGKQGYNDASISQDAINELLVKHALLGHQVMRLKGGDVAFFSNVLDELFSLTANDIPFEIIPGITAAAGASAYAGIPLTARGFSQGVQWITFNPSANFHPEKWRFLATTSDTLVFYMASKALGSLAELLLRYMSNKKDVPVAVIEQATTPYQKVSIATLRTCEEKFANQSFASPSLVIVGEVVRLHEQFKWFEVLDSSGSVFNTLVKQ